MVVLALLVSVQAMCLSAAAMSDFTAASASFQTPLLHGGKSGGLLLRPMSCRLKATCTLTCGLLWMHPFSHITFLRRTLVKHISMNVHVCELACRQGGAPRRHKHRSLLSDGGNICSEHVSMHLE